ncbi:MAG TPA: class I SAM-dependent methyltransferase [Gaiellaceae bacterium]|jgi:SAM-dependent methyltransferase
MSTTTICKICRAQLVADRPVYRKDGFDIVRCDRCGVLQRAVLPTRADLDELYDAGFFKDDHADPGRNAYADYLDDELSHRRTARERLDRLERHLTVPRPRVLDVGCAAGFFVAEAQARGWEAEGLDVSAEIVEWGREHLSANLSVGSFDEVHADAPAFDVVTMWDYVEHSLDPVGDLERARTVLEPGGLLALSTGDVESPVARLSGSRWHLLNPRYHNFFFGRRTLGQLLQRLGLEVETVSHPGGRYSLAHVLLKADTMLPAGVARRASLRLGRSRLGGLGIPLNLFDIVTVVARKPARG